MNKIVREYFPLIALLIIAAFLFLYKIDKPFYGYHDWNGVRYGQIARNYLRYGIVVTKLGQIENGGIVTADNFQYLTHYPPLLPLLISASFAIFGISEWSARIVPALFSLGSLIFFFLLIKEFWDKRVAIVSSFLLIATPMFIYFGRLPTHEPVSLFFSLAAIFFFFRWLKNSKNLDFLILFVTLFLGELTGWAIYFVLPLFTIFTFVLRKELLGKILILWLSSILIFLLHLTHTFFITGSLFGGGLLEVFLFRTNIGDAATLYPFTWIEFFFKEISYVIQFLGLVLLGLSLIWLIGFFVRLANKTLSSQDTIIFFLLFFGLSYPAVFRNIAFVHDYILFYILPFFAIAGAEILISISTKLPKFLIPAFIGGAVLLVFFERVSFIQALWESQADEPGYRLGRLLAGQTKPLDKIFVANKSFGNAHGRFVIFYSDRDVAYEDEAGEAFNKFDYLVEVKDGEFKITEIRK